MSTAFADVKLEHSHGIHRRFTFRTTNHRFLGYHDRDVVLVVLSLQALQGMPGLWVTAGLLHLLHFCFDCMIIPQTAGEKLVNEVMWEF
jgi:hypothetical protein